MIPDIKHWWKVLKKKKPSYSYIHCVAKIYCYPLVLLDNNKIHALVKIIFLYWVRLKKENVTSHRGRGVDQFHKSGVGVRNRSKIVSRIIWMAPYLRDWKQEICNFGTGLSLCNSVNAEVHLSFLQQSQHTIECYVVTCQESNLRKI